MTEPFSTRQRGGARWAPVGVLAVSAATTGFLVTNGGEVPLFFVIASGLFTATAAYWAASVLAARLTLDAAGVLAEHGLRAARTRRVDLSRLAAARAVEEASVTGTGDDRRISVRQSLQLRDALGQDLRLDPHTWHRGDLLVAAVEAAAAARGVPVEGGELFGLRSAGSGTPDPAPETLDPAAAPPVPDRDLSFPLATDLRFVLAFFGLVLGFIGLTFVALGAGPSMLSGAGDGMWVLGLFPVLGVAMLIASPLLLLNATASRITLRRDGRLAVRRLPPLPRRVRLGELAAVEATPAGYHSINSRVIAKTRVVLVDRAGARTHFTGESWRDPGVLMPAIAAWAARSGATMDASTRAYLLQGRRPAPRGPRPAAP